MKPDIDELRQWIGREQEAQEQVTPRLAELLRAILDETGPALRDGDLAPAGIHWCVTNDIAPMSALGPDGHPRRGGFLPPVSLPRRMWAGSRLQTLRPLAVGEQVRRHSRIADVVLKEGRSGTLCFVAVDHEYSGDQGLAVRERQDIVYRDATPAAPMSKPARADGAEAARTIQAEIDADPVLLFRYSAATSNGHRIHYDRAYCIDVEHYPGLIVHGPLQATLLWNLAIRSQGSCFTTQFAFRGTGPLFDGQRFALHSRPASDNRLELWSTASDGTTTMTASASF